MRQLKKELQAIKQRKEESSKPAEDAVKEGMCTDDACVLGISCLFGTMWATLRCILTMFEGDYGDFNENNRLCVFVMLSCSLCVFAP